jgi:hypothetical protein
MKNRIFDCRSYSNHWAKHGIIFVKVVEGSLLYHFAIYNLWHLCRKILRKRWSKLVKRNGERTPSRMPPRHRAKVHRRPVLYRRPGPPWHHALRGRARTQAPGSPRRGVSRPYARPRQALPAPAVVLSARTRPVPLACAPGLQTEAGSLLFKAVKLSPRVCAPSPPWAHRRPAIGTAEPSHPLRL